MLLGSSRPSTIGCHTSKPPIARSTATKIGTKTRGGRPLKRLHTGSSTLDRARSTRFVPRQRSAWLFESLACAVLEVLVMAPAGGARAALEAPVMAPASAARAALEAPVMAPASAARAALNAL